MTANVRGTSSPDSRQIYRQQPIDNTATIPESDNQWEKPTQENPATLKQGVNSDDR